MHVMKRLGLGLLAFLLSTSLAGLVAASIFAATLGKPDTLKSWLGESGVYPAGVNSLVEEASRQATGKNEQTAVNQPIVQDIFKATLTPQVAQNTIEQIIDGTYNWLGGKSEKPDYKVDLTELKNTFALKSADAAEQRALSLPVCTVQQLSELSPEINVFDLPCRPPGLDLAAEKQKLIQEISSSEGLLADPVITADTFKGEGSDQKPIYQNLEAMPSAFQWAKKLPWIFGISALLSAAGIIFSGSDHRKGLRKVAFSLLTSGVLLLITVFAVSIVTRWLSTNKNLIKEASADLQSALLALGKLVASDINQVLLIIGASFVIIAACALIYLRITKPEMNKSAEPKVEPETEAAKPEAPTEE